MNSEQFSNFMNDVNQNLKDLLKELYPYGTLYGIQALSMIKNIIVCSFSNSFFLDALLDVEFDFDDASLSSQWAVFLRSALHMSETIEIAREGSKCLGRLVRIYHKTLPR